MAGRRWLASANGHQFFRLFATRSLLLGNAARRTAPMTFLAPTYCPGTTCDPCLKRRITGTVIVAVGAYGPDFLHRTYAVQANITITFTMTAGGTETTSIAPSAHGFIYSGGGTAPIAVNQPMAPPSNDPYVGHSIICTVAYVVFGGPGGTFITTADTSGLTIH